MNVEIKKKDVCMFTPDYFGIAKITKQYRPVCLHMPAYFSGGASGSGKKRVRREFR